LNKTKILLVIIIIAVIASYIFFDLGRFLTLDFIQSQLSEIQQFRDENFGLTALLYFTAYVAITALSIPGAVIVTLLGGAIFGVLWGTLIVSFASSIGATLAFLVSRLLLRDWVQSKFGHYLGPINRGVEKDGNFYLFSIRMVPLFPFFMVNLLMGLTPISVGSFYIVSQIGMLVGTAVYVNAGSELAQITSLSGLVSPSVILSFVLLGIFPLAAKFIVGLIQRNKS
jgi:uncharacterized membrane protein YdjX (TVP38/TMEM64 family)